VLRPEGSHHDRWHIEESNARADFTLPLRSQNQRVSTYLVILLRYEADIPGRAKSTPSNVLEGPRTISPHAEEGKHHVSITPCDAMNYGVCLAMRISGVN